MPGRGRSPVQQAWDYAIDAPGSRWVLVSNCLETRLYACGRGRDAWSAGYPIDSLDLQWGAVQHVVDLFTASAVWSATSRPASTSPKP